MRPLQILVALAFALGLPGLALAETTERFDVGFWRGGAQVDNDGNLFDCYLRAEHKRENYGIYLRYDGEGMHLSLMHDDWVMESGLEFRGRVRIDQRFDEDLRGRVLGATIVDYLIGFDDIAINAIKDGSQISLEGPQGAKKFPLTGTGKATEALMRCADKYYPQVRASGGRGGAAVPKQAMPTQPKPPLQAPRSATASQDVGALITKALMIATGQAKGTPGEAFAAADAAAQMGDRRGHWLSGRFALSGYGTDITHEAALARVLLAAEAGHPEAQTYLAFEYLNSDDPVRQLVGRDYLNRAAAQAHAPALAALRLMEAGDVR